MATAQEQVGSNRGICSKCNKIVPARHEDRDGKVFLVKECSECGTTEAMISLNAERYNQKRAQMHYESECRACALNCTDCAMHKDPTIVFVDVTNRCNMNCPICLANIPSMGFRFDPPMAYFEKIFERLSRIDPKPKVQLFGGEPTVRKDLVDIIVMAKKKFGLSARVVTNGLRLADEAYCKELVDTGTEFMFSFDGRHPEIYEKMRKHPTAYEKKMKGLENLSKIRKSKVTIMCCVGKGLNDMHMADTIAYCHENRNFIAALDLIPLTAQWGPEEVDVESTTIEGVEDIMSTAVPGTQFFPAGMLYTLDNLRATFDVGRLTFGGAHPNCEVVSVMISDGEAYQPVAKFLTRPLQDVVQDLVTLDLEMTERLEKSLIARLFGRKGRQLVFGKALLGLAWRSAKMDEVFVGSAKGKILRILWGLARGVKMKHLLRAHTRCHDILRLIILPFEEKECVESARLVDCPAAFAYEHPVTREVGMMPVCAWTTYKNDVMRITAEHYGVADSGGEDGLTGLKQRTELEKEAVEENPDDGKPERP